MPGNTLFYAYIHNSGGVNDVIVFASRYVADEWWRAISSLTNLTSAQATVCNFQRISAQLYAYDYVYQSNFPSFTKLFGDLPFKDIASQFRGKMFITSATGQWGELSTIPEQEVVDHLNGNLFYIRSKHNPDLFWNYGYSSQYPGGEVSLSTAPTRSRFRVIAADSTLAEGTVLIGSDKVTIQIAEGLYVTVSESNQLVSSNQPREFLFSDLIGGKFTSVDETSLVFSAHQSGDAWELA